MKKQLIVASGVLSAAALAGIAVAQVSSAIWPQLSPDDLEQCRPVIAQVHDLEKRYVREVVAGECNAPARFYSAESCRSARKWLAQTEVQDDVAWFFKGNDRCQGSDYPCFGVKIYNQVREGGEATRWSRYFLEKAGKPYSVTPGMDFWTSAREADTCISGVWAGKYRTANARQQPENTAVAAAAPEAPPEPPLVPSATPLESTPVATPVSEPAVLAGAAVAASAATAALTSAEPAASPPAAPAVSATAPAVSAVAAPAASAAAAPAVSAAAAPAVSTQAAAVVVASSTGPAGDCANAGTDAAKRVDACSAAIKALKPGDPAHDELATYRIAALVAAGKPAEAIAEGDKLAASKPNGEGQLAACKARVLAKQQLDKALVACYSTGKPSDPAMLETRGQVHLLAGRHHDAWNDFNAAWTGGQKNSALFLRGLSSAGLGKTTDAVKDIAKAEEAQPGITNSFEAQGYTLAAAMAGKPMVGAEAVGGAVTVAHKPAPAKPAPAPAAAAAAATPAADVPAAVPAAPIVPLPNAVYPPATDPPPAGPPASVAPAPVAAPAAAVPVAAPAAAPVAAPTANFSAATGNAVSVPGLSVPHVTDCLEPVAPGNGGQGAFKNKCNYPVRFTYCNIKPAKGVEQLTCGSNTAFRAETIGGNGSQPAVLGQSVAYFACRGPSLPEVIYTSNNGLEGYCR